MYDVALSFAGEDRAYVEAVARALKSSGVRVFYDRFEEANLWGKDLYTHLRQIYEREARYAVVFISHHYARKTWTGHERQSVQSRALVSPTEYLLPARFDDSEVPGIASTIGYVDLRGRSAVEFANLIVQKLGGRFEPHPRHWLDGSIFPAAGRNEVATVLGIGGDNRAVDLLPGGYKNIGEVLDDIYLNYLSEQFPAYSYGVDWLLKKAGATQLLAPWEWAQTCTGAADRLSPEWPALPPEQAGFKPGTNWRVMRLKSRDDAIRSADVVLCRDARLLDLVDRNAKVVRSEAFRVAGPIPQWPPSTNARVFRAYGDESILWEQVDNETIVDDAVSRFENLYSAK